MEKQEKKAGSRLGMACKIVGTIHGVGGVGVGLLALGVGLAQYTSSIGAVLSAMLSSCTLAILYWSIGILLDRQKENQETLAEIKALLGGEEPGEDEEDLAALEQRLDAALESGEEPEEDAWTESSGEET